MPQAVDAEGMAHLIDMAGICQAEVTKQPGIAESTISAVAQSNRRLNLLHGGARAYCCSFRSGVPSAPSSIAYRRSVAITYSTPPA